VQGTPKRERFEQTDLPHLDAAYNLARWLTRNDLDAQDATQEACLRAFRNLTQRPQRKATEDAESLVVN